MASHAPWAVFNRSVNPLVRGVLRSPLHGLLSRGLALITVTGRSSGRSFTFPVSYEQAGPDEIRITVKFPAGKRWWRNLTGEGGRVALTLRGSRRAGRAVATGTPETGVVVSVALDPEGAAR